MPSPSQSLDDVINDSFIGLYATDEDGNFVPVNDKYGVLADSLKAAITQLVSDIVGADQYDLTSPRREYVNDLRNSQRQTAKSLGIEL